MKILKIFILICSLCFLGGSEDNANHMPPNSKVLKLHGSTTFYDNLIRGHRTKIWKDTNFALKVVAQGSVFGVIDILRDQSDKERADISMTSTNLNNLSEILLRKIIEFPSAHKNISNYANLKQTKIGENQISFIVNKHSSSLKSLTREEIIALLNAKIKLSRETKYNYIFVLETVGGIRETVKAIFLDSNDFPNHLFDSKDQRIINAESSDHAIELLANGYNQEKYIAIVNRKLFNPDMHTEIYSSEEDKLELFLITDGDPDDDIAQLIQSLKEIANSK